MTDDSRSERAAQNPDANRAVSAQGVFNRGPPRRTPDDADDATDETAADDASSSERTSETATGDVTAQGVFDRGGSLSD
ncbi:MAG: hypothetical protein ABEI99_04010 [Halobaculum sp.]